MKISCSRCGAEHAFRYCAGNVLNAVYKLLMGQKVEGCPVPYYRTCPHCGAHLDPGERCDCQNKQKKPTDTDKPIKK